MKRMKTAVKALLDAMGIGLAALIMAGFVYAFATARNESSDDAINKAYHEGYEIGKKAGMSGCNSEWLTFK